MNNHRIAKLLLPIIILLSANSCQEKTNLANRPIKSITEWECDQCLWGLNLFVRKAKTQFFDSTGKLTLEWQHITSTMFDAEEHYYDRFNRLWYLKNYRVEGTDTTNFVVREHFYSSEGRLMKVEWSGKANQPFALRTLGYDSLGRMVEDIYLEYNSKYGEDRQVFQYDSLNRLIRSTGGYGAPDFYSYPSPHLELKTSYDHLGKITYQEKKYRNADKQLVADSVFIYDFPQKVSNNLYESSSYTYDRANRVTKYYRHYYYLTDCGVGQQPGWYTQIIDYQYQYY
jgi:hypothetical protein